MDIDIQIHKIGGDDIEQQNEVAKLYFIFK